MEFNRKRALINAIINQQLREMRKAGLIQEISLYAQQLYMMTIKELKNVLSKTKTNG